MRWPWVRRRRLEVQMEMVATLGDSLARSERLLRMMERQRDTARAEHGKSLDRIAFLQKELAKADVKGAIG